MDFRWQVCCSWQSVLFFVRTVLRKLVALWSVKVQTDLVTHTHTILSGCDVYVVLLGEELLIASRRLAFALTDTLANEAQPSLRGSFDRLSSHCCLMINLTLIVRIKGVAGT